MANEILYSGLSDQRVAAVLSETYSLLLADREAGALSHPAIQYAGAGFARRGSTVVQIPQIGLMGYDLLTAASTEGSSEANAALTDGNDQVTVARYGKIYEASDLARLTDPGTGILDVSAMAMDLVASTGQTLIDLIAALASGFSSTVGSTGVDLSYTNFTDAITTLEIAKVTGQLMAILHPRQFGDLRTASLSLGGAVQHMPDPQGLVRYAGSLYKGRIFGVDVFTSSHVDTANAGADRAGMMIAPGAVWWGDAEIPTPPGAALWVPLMVEGKVRAALEASRTARSALSAWHQHAYLGVTEGLDAAGVGIITDA